MRTNKQTESNVYTGFEQNSGSARSHFLLSHEIQDHLLHVGAEVPQQALLAEARDPWVETQDDLPPNLRLDEVLLGSPLGSPL
jgi:hypothetical protein